MPPNNNVDTHFAPPPVPTGEAVPTAKAAAAGEAVVDSVAPTKGLGPGDGLFVLLKLSKLNIVQVGVDKGDCVQRSGI